MKYIALLRGVNVGGNNRVPMNNLKACFENAGFQNVRTYINSGNVIFDSDETDKSKLMERCEDLLKNEFGFPISLALLDRDDLREALEHAPEWWGDDPDSKHNTIFVIQPFTAEEVVSEAGNIKPEYEQLYVYKEIIFWSASIKTFSRTRWSRIVGTKAYQKVTIRNANTARKILELVLAEN